MKCPHCGYEHGWSPEELKMVDGDDGNFFILEKELNMVKKEYGATTFRTKYKTLHGCPKCSKIFMD